MVEDMMFGKRENPLGAKPLQGSLDEQGGGPSLFLMGYATNREGKSWDYM